MTEKELKRMGRRELIEIIALMKREETDLRERLKQAEEALADRSIRLEKAGSIAEAALSLHEVFAAAQAAADTYLLSLRAWNGEMESRRAQEEERCALVLQEAEQEAAACLQAAESRCAQRLAETEAEIGRRWEEFQSNVRNVLQSHSELSGHLQEAQKG